MASPSRRSARKKARVSYDESIVEVAQEKEMPKRRGPPKKRPVATYSSGSDESKDEPQKPPPSKKRKAARGTAEERTCSHCNQVCSSKSGLKYHVEHFVCRPALNPTGKPKTRGKGKKRAPPPPDSDDDDDDEYTEESAVAAAKPKASKTKRGKKRAAPPPDSDDDDEYTEESAVAAAKPKASKTKRGKKKFKKIRGPLSARTCPHCKKVFTSTLGKEYHVQNKVCTDKKPLQADTKTPFPTLEPGQQFVTAFGVVLVIADNRAIPTATLPEDAELKAKAFRSSNQKSRMQQQKGNVAAAVKTRVQRMKLSQVYQKGHVSQRNVWKAMYGGDPRVIAKQRSNRPAQSKGPSARPDPLTPEGSYPDRIVECVLIPDERGKYPQDDSDDDDKDETMEDATKSPYGMTLFLRRRILTEPYVASSTIYSCQDCGQPFGSKVGYSYHTKGKVCISKRTKMSSNNRKFLETVEARAAKEVSRRVRPERKKSRKNVPVYPQVWLSLGFKFVAVKPPTKPHIVEEPEEEPEPLDDVLSRLRNQLRRDHDRSLGTMYPAVFDALQFQRPPPLWKVLEEQQMELRRQEESAKIRLKLQKEQAKAKNAKKRAKGRSQKPPPPIVDIQVLADEADTGRYPSVKRFHGEHDDVCTICKNQVEGTLYCCDFCQRVVHLDCIREKHTIKEPEPREDFMCHICIQYIQARRNRAEKRRIQKQKTALQKTGGANDVLAGSGGESEYHDVADLGHELRDLTELLQDGKVRLRQAIGVSKMNDARRSMLV